MDDPQLVLLALLHLGVVGPAAVAHLKPLVRQMPQVRFVTEALRDFDVRQVILLVVRVRVAHLGDLERVRERAVRHVDVGQEGLAHLREAFEEVVVPVVAHALGVVELGAGLHAEQHVVRGGVLFTHVVHVVRDHDRHVVLLREGPELLIDLGQLRDAVFLELDVPPVGAEHIAVPHQPLNREVLFAVLQQARQLGGQAAGGADQPLAVRGEILRIDARPVVIPLELRIGANF